MTKSDSSSASHSSFWSLLSRARKSPLLLLVSLCIGVFIGGWIHKIGPSAHTDSLGGNSSAYRIAGRKSITLLAQVPQPIPFETAEAKLGAPLPLPPITARIVTIESHTSPAYAPLEGRIDHVEVRLGETVAVGARLALVRSGDLATMLKDLRASAAMAQTKKALAERMSVLVESRGASANDLLVAQNDLRDAELQAKTADSRLKSLSIATAGDNLYWLLAPRGGVVTQIDAAPGQQVGPGRDRPVVTLADLDEVLVLADVPQHDLGGLRVGDPVDIRIPGDNDSIGTGTIENISQVVDAERQTVPIRVRAKNPDRLLRPNAFVEAHFGEGGTVQHSVIRVPIESVVSDGLQAVVFVETEPGHFKRQEVTLGRQSRKYAEVRAGLNAGDKVVTRGALLLLNSLSVEG
ncbi:MAG: efflux RND transporter periplasmic adaptor subunit [Myxococcales bacterium]|nr:efflux RND transporter periplasmic adaptor subunit [Myxococcales bacterium]